MNLIDRPDGDQAVTTHPVGGATASAGLHVLVAMIALMAFRAIPERAASPSTNSLAPDHMIWIPQTEIGGGRSGGGSMDPPRRALAVGADATTVPAPQHPTESITSEPPEEVAAIPARPMSDATTALVGILDSRSTTGSAGPGSDRTGAVDGSDRGGGGHTPGPGFGPGDAVRGGPGVTMPSIVLQVNPRYTADAMRLRIQGAVWIECVVMPDGTVSDARILRSLDSRFGLDEEAIAAAKQWRFRPGTLYGRPVPVVVTIELMFSVR